MITNSQQIPPETAQTQKQEVIVTDIEMPFSSMVMFMVKCSLAAIPALIILGIPAVLIFILLAGIGTAVSGQQVGGLSRLSGSAKPSHSPQLTTDNFG